MASRARLVGLNHVALEVGDVEEALSVPEASLVEAASGLVPASEGWFVVNATEAAWVGNPDFGWRCSFEANGPALRESPEPGASSLPPARLPPPRPRAGKPSGLYHAESEQEDFLVLAGECLLVVEEEERRLRAWDFVHCPPGTRHVFVGTDGPCVILMTGARADEGSILYPLSEAAARHGAAAQAETRSPHEAYAPHPHWQPGRPAPGGLPWEGGSVSRARLVGLNHVALEVGDVEEALEFYGRIFELELRGRSGRMAFVDMGDQFVALAQGRTQPPDAHRHFGLVVDDKEAARRALQEAGVEVPRSGRLDFRDPWGNHVEVVDYREIQFTKAENVLRGMGLDGLEKSEKALEELRSKGLAD